MTRVRLSLPPRFSFDAVVRSHGWFDLPPFEYDRERGVLRTVVAWRRRATAVAFQVRGGRLDATGDGLDVGALRSIARRVFSLDLDFTDAERSFVHEPPLARALAERGGRMLRAPAVFEDAVKVLFTTNCSWAATRGMVSRLIALAGAGGTAFPEAREVAALSTAAIEKKVRCGYRAAALTAFARRVASGKLDLSAWEDPHRDSDEVREAIISERGFGPYAAETLLRILGRHDFFALDSWTRQQFRRLHPGKASTADRAIVRRYSRFGAHRGLALWLEMTGPWHAEVPEQWPAATPEGRITRSK